jgi:hypothetical protein
MMQHEEILLIRLKTLNETLYAKFLSDVEWAKAKRKLFGHDSFKFQCSPHQLSWPIMLANPKAISYFYWKSCPTGVRYFLFFWKNCPTGVLAIFTICNHLGGVLVKHLDLIASIAECILVQKGLVLSILPPM